MRYWVSVLLVTAILTAMVGSALAAKTSPGSLTVRGRLQMVTTFGAPHYELSGYVVLHEDPSILATLVGLEVVASGEEFTGPSIYMRKALKLKAIAPVVPASAPVEELPITIPVMPSPDLAQPDTGHQVGVPSPPPRFFGTSFYLLFGRLEEVEVNGDTRHYLYTEEADGKSAYLINGSLVNLRALVGRQVGALASAVTQSSIVRYDVHTAVAVDGDIAQMLHNDKGIYSRLPEPITVLLRGHPISFDRGAGPILGNGRTLVGLRAIAEVLGASITWDDETRTAIVSLGDKEVLVRVGTTRVQVRRRDRQDAVVMADIAPVLFHGRTMVPLRIITEGLGLRVDWNDSLRRVELR